MDRISGAVSIRSSDTPSPTGLTSGIAKRQTIDARDYSRLGLTITQGPEPGRERLSLTNFDHPNCLPTETIDQARRDTRAIEGKSLYANASLIPAQSSSARSSPRWLGITPWFPPPPPLA